ncbi:ankyrin repeat domain-containing protein 29-like [Haliotis asinina]|uniref:ankyrin repeat domain-containing protein 29-like n=1 Tax=Haliotis asinina TaxID=109174 RepID=UPI003532621F
MSATRTPVRRYSRADVDLHDACRKGDLAEVKRIQDTGRGDVNSRDGVGRTPLMEAARLGHRDVVKLPVVRGADVSLVDDDGNNILHYACVRGDRKTVELVLSLGALDINSRGPGNRTPIMEVAGRGCRDLVELFVKRGADVSLVSDDGDNILHWAYVGGDRMTVNVVSIDARTSNGDTAADVVKGK